MNEQEYRQLAETVKPTLDLDWDQQKESNWEEYVECYLDNWEDENSGDEDYALDYLHAFVEAWD